MSDDDARAPRLGRPVPEALARATVLDAAGDPHSFSEAWSQGAALVVFVRQFACLGCSLNVRDLAPRLEQFGKIGLQTTLVGCGPPEAIAGFVERFELEGAPVRVWTDPSLEVQRLAGLHRSFFRTWGLSSLGHTIRALFGGHKMRAPEGDARQLGGALMVDGAGRVAYYHRSRSLGGHAPAVELVDAALGLSLAA